MFFIIIWASVLTLGTFVLAVSILIRRPRLPLFVIVVYFKVFYKFFGIKVSVSGRGGLNPGSSYLFLSNHQSFIDIPLIFTIRPVSFVSKIEIRRWPLFGLGMKNTKCIFVDRSDGESRKKVGPAMLKNMAEGTDYCVFPEGTRSLGGTLLPFRLGIFKVAQSSGLEVVPVTICNTWQILPKNSMKLSCGTIRCVVHSPVKPGEFKTPEDLMNHTRKVIESAL